MSHTYPIPFIPFLTVQKKKSMQMSSHFFILYLFLLVIPWPFLPFLLYPFFPLTFSQVILLHLFLFHRLLNLRSIPSFFFIILSSLFNSLLFFFRRFLFFFLFYFTFCHSLLHSSLHFHLLSPFTSSSLSPILTFLVLLFPTFTYHDPISLLLPHHSSFPHISSSFLRSPSLLYSTPLPHFPWGPEWKIKLLFIRRSMHISNASNLLF